MPEHVGICPWHSRDSREVALLAAVPNRAFQPFFLKDETFWGISPCFTSASSQPGCLDIRDTELGFLALLFARFGIIKRKQSPDSSPVFIFPS